MLTIVDVCGRKKLMEETLDIVNCEKRGDTEIYE